MKVALLIMAAGRSSRFGGNPKMLCKVGPNEESLFEVSLQQMRRSVKICHIHLVVNADNKAQIMEEVHLVNFKHNICDKITYNIQEIGEGRSKPWGTADAVASAAPYMETQFLLINSDDLYGNQTFDMISKQCTSTGNYIIGFALGATLQENKPANRGFITLRTDGNVSGLQENVNIDNTMFSEYELNNQYVSVNLLLLQPSILAYLIRDVDTFKSENTHNYTVESFLPNFLNALICNGELTLEMIKSAGTWMGVTYNDDVTELRRAICDANA
jgi:bifunctional N-acetylglucosamine-1-phosphate-uridyltransferase/glucosamine-1-phosphate-acetyltransferase GlmU-like protein